MIFILCAVNVNLKEPAEKVYR